MQKISPGMLSTLLLTIAVASCSHAAPAQHEHDHHSAYAEQGSEIASLSLEEIEQLSNGEGMGLARAAELNRYPGPRHVIDAAEELGLSETQKARSAEIFDTMKREAIRVGQEIIEKERVLSRRFEHRHIDDESLRGLTSEIASLQGELRRIHLEAHLRMAEILTDEQIARYDELRGYVSAER